MNQSLTVLSSSVDDIEARQWLVHKKRDPRRNYFLGPSAH